jgi:lambda family phage portal protein
MRDNWLDRALGWLAPGVALQRLRARTATAILQRHYEAASDGRRTQGWYRTSTDANAAVGASLAKLRDAAHDLVRNNPYAESALSTIVDHTVGWGIVPTVKNKAFEQWSESKDCDADGTHDLAGLQKLVMRSVVESGEVLVRRRIRRLEDGLPLPLQLQVLEADFLDTLKDGALAGGGRIVQGVEFDALGRRAAYWLFKTHPGSSWHSGAIFGQSVRIPASEILHIFKPGRPGQVRGPSWFAPLLLRFKDFDEYDDATLVKQKIAACLAIVTSDVDGTAPPLGTAGTTPRAAPSTPQTDTLSPGMILNAPPGRSIEVVQPPSVAEYSDYVRTQLRAIATGLGISYEDLTGDYTATNYSSARMARLKHQARVDDWRWRILIPQFLDPIWTWAMQAAEITGLEAARETSWTPPPLPMVEPDKEGLAIMRNVRAGIQTLSEAIRERGYLPEVHLDELANDFAALDARGLVLDIDPRRMTQAGQAQGGQIAATASVTPKE